MNKLQFFEGGHSLKLDEFNLMQNSYLEGFKALIYKLFPTGNGFLDGCDITMTSSIDGSFTAGHVSIKGEIYIVDAGTFSGTPSTLYFNIPVNPYDGVSLELPSGSPTTVVYENSIRHDVHIERKAILQIYDSTTCLNGCYYNAMEYPGIVLEGGIIPWIPPTGKAITDYFDSTGKGINGAKGYAVCNGNNGTADLRGMFLAMTTNALSATALKPILGSVTANAGDETGANTVALNASQNATHTHTINDSGHAHNVRYYWYSERGANSSVNIGSVGSISPSGPSSTYNKLAVSDTTLTGISINNAGSGTPHENRPPTRYLYYITRINTLT